MVGGGWTKTKLMLNSTQVEVKVEVGVELGKNKMYDITRLYMCTHNTDSAYNTVRNITGILA